MKRRLRILYEIHPHSLGGTERFLARFLPHVDRTRYEPVVISARDGNPLRLIASMGVKTVVTDQYFTRRGMELIAAVIQRERIDIVQSNYYASSLALAANLAGVPHLWRLGGHVAVGSGAKHQNDFALTLEMIRMLSGGIVCNSRFVRSQFEGSRGPRMTVIQNGIALPRAVVRRGERRPFHIRMIAHFISQKRHDDFIDAAERLVRRRDDVVFSLVGRPNQDPASRQYAAAIRKRTAALRRAGKLQISAFTLGAHDPYHDADVIVLPSVRESFSNAILEAMAAGLPVIAARSGGNPELVRDGATGLLVPPEDPRALAAAMRSLLDDPERMVRMGRAGRRRAREAFSMEACWRRYEDEYRRLLSQ